MTYPILKLELTNGTDTKEISFSNPKIPVDSEDVIAAGGSIANILDDDDGYSFVQGHLITDSIVAQAD